MTFLLKSVIDAPPNADVYLSYENYAKAQQEIELFSALEKILLEIPTMTPDKAIPCDTVYYIDRIWFTRKRLQESQHDNQS